MNHPSPPFQTQLKRHLDACLDEAPQWVEMIMRDVREVVRQSRDVHVRAATPTVVAELREALENLYPLLARSFVDALRARVQQVLEPGKTASAGAMPGASGSPHLSLEAINTDDLHLVDEDQAEEEIEVIRVVQLADSAAEWELRELQARCATLRGEASVGRDSNPLRPEAVARALWEAAQALKLSSPSRTLLMRLAAGPLARELRAAYARMLERLEQWQIVPAAYRAVPVVGVADPRFADAPRPDFDVTQPGKFEELMRAAAAVGPGADAYAAAFAGGLSAQTLEKLEAVLQRALASLPPVPVHAQQAAPGPGAQGVPAWSAAWPAHPGSPAPGVPNLIRQHQAQLQDAARHDKDRLVIATLAQLFDKILCDPHLLPPVQESLGRLQAAVLRCALNDPRLLDDHAHPSWLLLNRVASYSLGYESPQDPRLLGFLNELDPILRSLERSGEHTAQRHREALQQVAALIAAQLHREQEEIGPVIARRRREEELAALQAAQGQRLSRRIGQAAHAAPPCVTRFVFGPWARVLASASLLHGENSPLAAKYEDAAHDLVLSVEPLHDARQRSWMMRTVPRLLECLREGMALIDMPAAERDAFLGDLMRVHTDNLKAGLRPAASTSPIAAPATASSTKPTPEELVARLRDDDDAAWRPGRTSDTVMDAASLDTVPAALMDGEAAAAPDLQAGQAGPRRSPLSPDEWLAGLKAGAWCRIFVAGRLTPLRLLWTSSTQGNWVFSSGAWNHDGPPRVLALTRRALERLYVERLAADLEAANLLERAADSLFRELQAGAHSAPAAPAPVTQGLLRLNLG